MYVKLRVGSEAYGLPVESVREITELGEVTPVPGSAAAVLGVSDLHGQVLPVFDLARVLGIPRDSSPPRIVVTEYTDCLAGLAVDEVTDVSKFNAEREETDSDYLSYGVLEEGQLIGVLDVERIFEALKEESP